MPESSAIDWSLFDKWSESTCTCRCGQVFRSHAKYAAARGGLISRKPCPGCGRDDDARSVRSDPEKFTIG